MEGLNKMRNRMTYIGKNLRSSHTNNSRALFEDTFTEDPSYRENVYRWSLGKKPGDYTEEDLIPMRVDSRRYSEANGWTVKFHTKMADPIATGDIIYVTDTNEYLICTENYNIDNIKWSGKFTLCNWMLKWQDSTGAILEYPCYVFNATQYNSGERATKLYTVGTSQYICKLPYDNNTVRLKTPQRFFMDKDVVNPSVFIVTQNDNTSYNFGDRGMIRITVFEDVIQDDDRVDLGICNYREPDTIDTEIGELKSVIDYTTKILKSGGTAKTFTAKFLDENGAELPNIVPKWTIVGIPKEVLEVKESGNKITLRIDNDDYVDESFKLVLTDEHNQYPSEVIITIDSII